MKPRISINVAISADGKITDHNSSPSGWTSKEDFQRLISLRKDADALLVGRKTLVADSMSMMVPGQIRQPLRCVISRMGEIPASHPIWNKGGGEIHLLGTAQKPGIPDESQVKYHRCSIPDFLERLHENRGVSTLHCEGGGWLFGELLAIRAIETIHCTVAGHTLFGGWGASTLSGLPGIRPTEISSAYRLADFDHREEADECFLTYRRA